MHAAALARDVEVFSPEPLLMGRMKKLHETLGGAAVLKKLRTLSAALEPKERAALGQELEKVRDVLTALAREVRGR